MEGWAREEECPKRFDILEVDENYEAESEHMTFWRFS